MNKIMHYIGILILLLSTGLVNAGSDKRAALDNASSKYGAAAAHLQRAKELAGEDLKYLADGIICQPAEQQIPWALKNVPGFLNPAAPGEEPFAALDNLYFIGQFGIGTWLLDTGEGLILFDSLNSHKDVINILLPGMKQLGLDPNDLKYLVITHTHFDHYGGADYLREKFGVPILMSEADLEYMPKDVALPYALKAGYPAITQPKPDRLVEDGEVLTLGNATVNFIITPGHTPGTISPIFSVQHQGRTHYLGMWGGNALHKDLRNLGEMHDSLHKFWNLAKARGVAGLISTHAFMTQSFTLHSEGREEDHLIGHEGVNRYFGIVDECIKAQFARSIAALDAQE